MGAIFEDIQNSEKLTIKEAKNLNQEQDNQGEKRLKAGRTRMVLPDELEREEIIIDPEGDLTDYKVIGQVVTEILLMFPACFKVRKIVLRKWALRDSVTSDAKGVLIAPIPSRTIKRGLVDESVLAYLLTGKFVDHLPLHR